MRLLFCCEHYFPSGGGVAEVMRQIAERMALSGHHVTVATSRVAERTSKSHHGVHIQDFEVGGNLALGMRGEVDRYRDFVLAFGADAILIKAAQQWTFDALWPILDRIAARKVFIPCGFSSLYEPAYANYFAQMPQALRKLDHLIFYAQSYRDVDFARAHGFDNLSVLPNGASELEFDKPPDLDFRDRIGISPDEFVFLTVGSPVYAKGHRQVAEAFARLDTGGRRATLILNGDWAASSPSLGHSAAERPATSKHARRGSLWQLTGRVGLALQRGYQALRREGFSGLRALVDRRLDRQRLARETEDWIRRANDQKGKRILRTNLPRPDLVEAYLASDLFVFASLVEYSPLVLFEAAAAGTPFLSVPAGNAEEIATWTGGGVICPAAKDARGYTRVEPEVLAREMARLLKDRDLRMRLGRTGRERWRREFTWESIAPRYEAILRGSAPGDPRAHQTLRSAGSY
jgi:glycosyltransferase involved in cell wall biosynthesis